MGENLTTDQPAVGQTVVDRAFVDLYGLQPATLMKVTGIACVYADGVAELVVTFHDDGEEVTDRAWSDEVYVVASGC